ncbi:TIGR01777 family oxidoreductase [Xanthomonas translucens pv. translucens]|uniref:TIGR01777 family oxidoreductase n=1 Tax=Xanthomonas campestris pv. translucens TaxID=343 RepID=UPI00129508EB|nr:TIGR01777 family oxidoreductase [Xanthomonas translucens]MQS40524.1 TIGR01777 family protein [Xanthomonas translucens pv. translucens]UII63572.1 TIGR01777 family oxidoreductase [Xanthomonas translucens]UKE51436.1 TIGR01777 family oxidoreductase [Xanthomonas translucens]
MHVLVTGGTGFIGRALCPALLQAGHQVSVLTRDAARAARTLPGVQALETLQDAAAAQAVINLAGEPLGEGRWNETRKRRFRTSRIGTTRTLLDWIAQLDPLQRPACLLSGSAIGYYGDRGNDLLDERSAAGADFSAQLCRDWETEALHAQALGLRTSLVRTGVVLGGDGGALARMLPPFRLGLGGRMGDGRQWMSWIHRDDHVGLLLWLLQHGGDGAYNATAPTPVTNADFAQQLGQALHRPALLPAPAAALRLAFGEMADLLLGSQRVLPTRAQQQGYVFRYPELGPALRAIVG